MVAVSTGNFSFAVKAFSRFYFFDNSTSERPNGDFLIL